MAESDRSWEQAIREKAYLIWEREGRPEGRAEYHWRFATAEYYDQGRGQDDESMEDEEKVLAGHEER
jgi:hypothetical protein